MNAHEIRLEKLGPMRVARFQAVGKRPEQEAWGKLRAWTELHGLLTDPTAHPVFGFNNPGPSHPGDEYGYEFWIRIDRSMPAGDLETLDFPGGDYAVTTVRGFPNPTTWMQLFEWVRNSPHRYRRAHELEHPHNPLAADSEMAFDLYLPIEETTSPREHATGE